MQGAGDRYRIRLFSRSKVKCWQDPTPCSVVGVLRGGQLRMAAAPPVGLGELGVPQCQVGNAYVTSRESCLSAGFMVWSSEQWQVELRSWEARFVVVLQCDCRGCRWSPAPGACVTLGSQVNLEKCKTHCCIFEVVITNAMKYFP